MATVIGDGRDALVRTVLPPAMEVMTAWSAAEEGEPALFRQALRRVLSDALDASDPSQAVAEVVFGMSSLSGILLDELADSTGRDRGQVLNDVHRRYLREDGEDTA